MKLITVLHYLVYKYIDILRLTSITINVITVFSMACEKNTMKNNIKLWLVRILVLFWYRKADGVMKWISFWGVSNWYLKNPNGNWITVVPPRCDEADLLSHSLVKFSTFSLSVDAGCLETIMLIFRSKFEPARDLAPLGFEFALRSNHKGMLWARLSLMYNKRT